MTTSRFSAIALIFVVVTAAWWILGAAVNLRTEQLDETLSAEMASLWGPKVLAQASPYCAGADGKRSDSSAGGPSAGKITADIRHEHRYKGLLWYSTFEVDFTGEYTMAAIGPNEPESPAPAGQFVFPLPAAATTYHALSVTLDGNAVAIAPGDISSGRIAVPLKRDVEHVVTVRYVTRGQDAWVYSPAEAPQVDDPGHPPAIPAAAKLCQLRNFSLTATTDFAEIDYPRGTLSPNSPATASPGGGVRASWDYPNLITSQSIGIAMPKRTNAGPIAARMSFFAPVSLLFFFTVLLAVVVLRHVPLHPMHYLFIAAGFFAFHILMTYLADLVNIHAAFWIAAGASVLLVVTYMRLVAGVKFALIYTGLAQLVYLVGFSYAFFWRGRTGLTVTIAAIVTLFVLMQATGRVDWHALLARPRREAPYPPPMPTELPPVE